MWIRDAHGVVRSFVCPAGVAARSVAEGVVRREGDMEGGGSEPCDGEAVLGYRGDEGGDDRVVGVPDRCWAQWAVSAAVRVDPNRTRSAPAAMALDDRSATFTLAAAMVCSLRLMNER